MRKPEGEAESAPNGGGTRGGDRGVMGERTPVPDRLPDAKAPQASPESVDSAPSARRKGLRFEIAHCVWGV